MSEESFDKSKVVEGSAYESARYQQEISSCLLVKHFDMIMDNITEKMQSSSISKTKKASRRV